MIYFEMISDHYGLLINMKLDIFILNFHLNSVKSKHKKIILVFRGKLKKRLNQLYFFHTKMCTFYYTITEIVHITSFHYL